MKAQVSTAVVVLTAISVAAGAQFAPGADAKSRAGGGDPGVPKVRQMVLFSGGATIGRAVVVRRTSVRVAGRRCTVPAATPLAALLAADPGRLAFHDYGSCSRRPADGGGLFVKAIRRERNKGLDGWVYKVGRELATAGAADPTGPFGAGRLRPGDRIVWFYCRQRATGSCQRTLEFDVELSGRRAAVTVTGYDDAGEGVPVAGATVRSGRRRASTDGEGRATLILARGRNVVHAAKRGTVRSFARRVTVE